MIRCASLGEVHEDLTFPFSIIIESAAGFDLGSSMLMCVLGTLIVCDGLLVIIGHADLDQVLVVVRNRVELSIYDVIHLLILLFYLKYYDSIFDSVSR